MRAIAGASNGAHKPEVERLRRVIVAHRRHPLEVQLMAALQDARDAGIKCYARSAALPLIAQQTSTTANVYELQIGEREHFVVASITRPATGALIQNIDVNGRNYIDNEMLGDHLLDDETSDDPVEWPAPMVLNGNNTLVVKATGTGLLSSTSTTYVTARGWYVDDILAEAMKAAGELAAFGINKAFAAAASMQDNFPRRITRDIDVERLVSKQTLTGDAVLQSVSLKVFDYELFPKGKCVPPPSTRKPGAHVDIPLRCNTEIQTALHYTSAGGAGTATLRTSWIGRRCN